MPMNPIVSRPPITPIKMTQIGTPAPYPIKSGLTEKARAYLLQIVQQIGQELLGHPETLRTFGLGVLRIEKNVHTGSIKLKMPAEGEGRDTAPAYRPKAEQRQAQSANGGGIALGLSFLVGVLTTMRRQSFFFHPH